VWFVRCELSHGLIVARTSNYQHLFSLDANFLAKLRTCYGDLYRQGSGDLAEGVTVGSGSIQGDGFAAITMDANRGVKRNLAQKREAQFFCGSARAAVSENIFAMASMGADISAHIFDHA
jgi:hypothetical protein